MLYSFVFTCSVLLCIVMDAEDRNLGSTRIPFVRSSQFGRGSHKSVPVPGWYSEDRQEAQSVLTPNDQSQAGPAVVFLRLESMRPTEEKKDRAGHEGLNGVWVSPYLMVADNCWNNKTATEITHEQWRNLNQKKPQLKIFFKSWQKK
jgi:hypothetical protein